MTTVKFAGNDYLGMAEEPRLADAMYGAAKTYGISATSSRFFLGWTDVHRQLEKDLSDFFSTESSCVIPSAYLGGGVYFSAMAETHKVVICDAFSHSNLFRGMRAAGFEILKYRHLDADDLERLLAAHDGPAPVVATDGIFGISGETAPLDRIVPLCEKAGAALLVDDAHGVFALGDRGNGTAEFFGVAESSCLTIMGSMSKALGVGGGFFAGRRDLMEKVQKASVGASPLTMPLAAACIEGIRIVRAEPDRRRRMWKNADRMRRVLTAQGVGVVCEQTPIIAMTLQDEHEAARLAEHFEARGLVIRYAKYPSEPRENLLRSAARACYSPEDLDRFEAAVKEYFG